MGFWSGLAYYFGFGGDSSEHADKNGEPTHLETESASPLEAEPVPTPPEVIFSPEAVPPAVPPIVTQPEFEPSRPRSVPAAPDVVSAPEIIPPVPEPDPDLDLIPPGLIPPDPVPVLAPSSPAAETLLRGVGYAISQSGFDRIKALLGTGEAEIWAIIAVETKGYGFLTSKRPVILFERHKFHRHTGGVYDNSHPDISHPKWGGYAGDQYQKMARAAALNHAAALKSASWGLGQVLGENAEELDYPDVIDFVARMRSSEDEHLEAMARFIVTNGLADALHNHDWRTFARRYNGPQYEKNSYHTRLDSRYRRYANGATPNLSVRQAQLYLSYLGYSPKGIDGFIGSKTRLALASFLKNIGQSDTDVDGMTAIPNDILALLGEEMDKLTDDWPVRTPPTS